MTRTMHASEMATVAIAARPCGALGGGYQWLNAPSIPVNATFVTDASTKRPARHLGNAPT